MGEWKTHTYFQQDGTVYQDEVWEPTPRRRWLRWLTVTVFGAAAIGGALLWPVAAGSEDEALVGPTVKVTNPTGYGSGVHIGNGYIVTAAHVVVGAPDLDIKLDDGSIIKDVEVMWINTKYDIALLHVGASEGFEGAALECTNPQIGTPITVEGNPLGMEFVVSYGHVGSTPQTVLWNGKVVWPIVYTIDADASPGNSGGPVYNEDGEVVGILVGRVPGEALRWAVPASVVCGLLGRV